ncbi:MAG: DUF1634 domain-containing protein [Thermomicrobiales bacterium]
MTPNAQPEPEVHAVPRDDLAPLYAAAVRTLQIGFRFGAALLFVGLVWTAIAGQSLGREVDAFDEIISALRDGHASGLIDLAILCFMATPVATVVVVTRGFYKIGDRSYTLLSSVVLAILAASIALSLFE